MGIAAVVKGFSALDELVAKRAFGHGWIFLALFGDTRQMNVIRYAPGIAATALIFALSGCTAMTVPNAVTNQEAFLRADERCVQSALRAVPPSRPHVIPCNSDGSYLNCATRSAFAITVVEPTLAEREAMEEATRLRKRAYADCMAG